MKKIGVLFGILFAMGLSACPLHITNDTDHAILLVETDGDYAQTVNPGQKAVIGNTTKHLGFYMFKPGVVSGSWVLSCVVVQHTCTADKRVDSTASIIENGNLDTTFFSYGKEITSH